MSGGVIRTFQADDPKRDVFVVGIDHDEELFHLASRFGVCLNARVMRERETGRSRGFGFIRYRTAAEAIKAVKAIDGLKYQARILHARPVDPTRAANIVKGNRTP